MSRGHDKFPDFNGKNVVVTGQHRGWELQLQLSLPYLVRQCLPVTSVRIRFLKPTVIFAPDI